MTEDPHEQANAEQVRVLREALAGAAEAGAGVPEAPGEVGGETDLSITTCGVLPARTP